MLVIIVIILLVAAVVTFAILQNNDVKRISAIETALAVQGYQVTSEAKDVLSAITSKVDALTSQLTATSTVVPVTIQGCVLGQCTNCTQTNFTFIQVGNLVFLQIPQINLGTCNGTVKQSLSIIGTIPITLRPKQELFFPIIMYAISATNLFIFHALPDGTMEIANTGGNPLGLFEAGTVDTFQIWPTTYSWVAM